MRYAKIRAVVTGLDEGFAVSVTGITEEGDLDVIYEEEADTIDGAGQAISEVGRQNGLRHGEVETIYNVDGQITLHPPGQAPH